MKTLLYIFMGGGIGSILRYLISVVVPKGFLPWGTLMANVISSFLLGVFIGWFAEMGTFDDRWRLLWLVGFCGGFSTFSTFSLESLLLLQNQQYMAFVLNILVSVIVCVCCVFLGIKLISIL